MGGRYRSPQRSRNVAMQDACEACEAGCLLYYMMPRCRATMDLMGDRSRLCTRIGVHAEVACEARQSGWGDVRTQGTFRGRVKKKKKDNWQAAVQIG